MENGEWRMENGEWKMGPSKVSCGMCGSVGTGRATAGRRAFVSRDCLYIQAEPFAPLFEKNGECFALLCGEKALLHKRDG
jgi:hypothetical protein